MGVEIRHFYTVEVMCRTVCWADIESDKNKLRSGTGMTSEKPKLGGLVENPAHEYTPLQRYALSCVQILDRTKRNSFFSLHFKMMTNNA